MTISTSKFVHPFVHPLIPVFENQLNFLAFEDKGDGSSVVGVITEVLSAPQFNLKYTCSD